MHAFDDKERRRPETMDVFLDMSGTPVSGQADRFFSELAYG